VPAIDSVGLGEGESLMCALAAGFPRMEGIAGLVWRSPDGRIVRNPTAERPADLDALAEPVRKVPFDACLGMPIAQMLGSRGCTHACDFCSIASWYRLCGGARFRLRSVAKLANEMARLYRRGARIFNFHDDNFVLGSSAATTGRVRALAAALAERNVGRIAMAIKARPGSVGEELFGELRDIGVFRVFLGIEAGTNKSLADLGRRQTVNENEQALRILNRLDFFVCFNLLMLNPDSTLEDFAADVAFLRRHPDNAMSFCRTEIYAGTPLEKRLRSSGRLRGDYWGYDYRIADPRAQEVFDVVFPAFRERVFGETSAHAMTTIIDHEHRILAHFFGTTLELRRAVRDYVREVNLNSVEHLEDGVAAVRSGFRSDAARAECREELTRRVGADDQRLWAMGQQLRDHVHAAAEAAQARAWQELAAC
jgi:anaerobic magnesium-protoporphyrin IX monomethyl ester cyclase